MTRSCKPYNCFGGSFWCRIMVCLTAIMTCEVVESSENQFSYRTESDDSTATRAIKCVAEVGCSHSNNID